MPKTKPRRATKLLIDKMIDNDVMLSIVGSTMGRMTGKLRQTTLAENGKPCYAFYDSERDYEIVLFLKQDAP